MLPWLFSTSLASDKDGSVELAEVLKDFCRQTGNDRKGTAAAAWLPINEGLADMERPITAERGWGSNDVRANRNRCIFSAGTVAQESSEQATIESVFKRSRTRSSELQH